VFKVGGAQAVAALAYGTRSLPPVDKITGPGNVFVVLAKRAVYGVVDIDGLAGPSEILVTRRRQLRRRPDRRRPGFAARSTTLWRGLCC